MPPVTPVSAIPVDFARPTQGQGARVRERQQVGTPQAAPQSQPPAADVQTRAGAQQLSSLAPRAGGNRQAALREAALQRDEVLQPARQDAQRAAAQQNAERVQARQDAARQDAARQDAQRLAAQQDAEQVQARRDAELSDAEQQAQEQAEERAQVASRQDELRVQTDAERTLAERAAQAYRSESERAVAQASSARGESAQPLNDQLQLARERLDARESVRIDRVDVSSASLGRIAY